MTHLTSLKLLPIAVLLIASPLAAHGEDLLGAYRAALQNDPVLAQSAANDRIAAEGVVQARSQLLPQINGSLSLQQASNGGSSSSQIQTNSNGNPITDSNGQPVYITNNTGHIRTRQLSANLNQTLFNFSKFENLKSAHSSEDSQNAAFRAAEQNLMVRVSTAYFNVLEAMDTLKYQQANAASLKRQLEQAQQRFNVGLSPITDVQDSKAKYDAAKSSVIAAENALADYREALTEITGTPSNHLKVLTQNLPMRAPSPNNQKQWVDTALTQNPSLQAQTYNVDAAEHSISAARGGHLPTLSASVSYGKSSSWAENGGLGYGTNRPASTTIGVTLTVPIFSGGYTQSQVRQAIDQRDSAQASATQQRRAVVRDTRNYYRAVIGGISQVQATKAAVASAKSALEATRAGFKVGTRTIVEVLLAQSTLLQSQQQYSQARHQFILDKLLLRQAAGNLHPENLHAVNALLVEQQPGQENQ